MKLLKLLLLFTYIHSSLYSQIDSVKYISSDSLRLHKIELELDKLIVRDSVYKSEVDLSVGNIPLQELIRNIAKIQGVNISIKDINNTIISCNFNRVRVYELIYFLCKEYNLNLDVTGNIVSLYKELITPKQKLRSQNYTQMTVGSNKLIVDSLGNITANIINGNIKDLIIDACKQLNYNTFFITPFSGVNSINVTNVNPHIFFTTLITGTDYTFYIENNIYFFSKKSQGKDLISVNIVPFIHRSVDKIIEVIPNGLKESVNVQSFPDLNCVILSGDRVRVNRIESFLKCIDKAVPLITMDIIIVDVNNKRSDEAGISIGKGTESTVTGGSLSPGIDLSIGAGTINKLINSFNGFGSIKLGNVSENLYVNLKFLEQTGNIVVESTPKLSTLNGQEAILESGETQYYKEVQNSYMGTQNPVQSTSYNWKSVDANLTIKITPYMSADSLITLNIDIKQSEFTPRIEKEAPPGIATRSFKSIIRVANGEVVLLGGIERKAREKSSRGLPGINRIPVLKWIFGRSVDSKSENKLNVFIRPSIIY